LRGPDKNQKTSPLLGTYSLNLLYYSWLVFYSLGLVFLLRNLTQNKGLIILGTAVGLVNPGVLNVIRDSPLTLYIGPIPWFIAFYYRQQLWDFLLSVALTPRQNPITAV